MTDDARRALAVRLICATAATTGALTLAVAAFTADSFAGAPTWLMLSLLLAVTATRLVPLHLTHRANSEALHLDEVFFVPMVIVLAPVQMLGALVIALLVGSAVTRRGGLKLIFNVGSLTTTAGLGIGVAHWLGDGTGDWRDYAGAFVGGLVCCAATALAVACVIAAASGAPVRTLLLDGARVRLLVWVGSLLLGTAIAVVARDHPVGLAVGLVPAALLHLGYADMVRQRRERTQADALYVAANRIHATVESEAVRRALVSSAQELLFAGSARITDRDEPEGPRSLRVPLSAGTALEVRDRATGGAWTAGDVSRLQALAAVASGALANAVLYEQIRAVMQSLGEGVLAIDGDGVIILVNPAARKLLGWPGDDLVGQQVASVVAPEHDVDGRWVHLARLMGGETVRLDEQVVVTRSGAPLDVALTASPVVRDGMVVGGVVVLRDIRERKVLQERLVHQAFHDSLTGLPNRALFLDRLEHAQARSRRDGETQAVLFVDIDRFKLINDSLGHHVGDEVLQAAARRIVGVMRPSDTVARFGGDEFTVLLESVHDPDEPVRAAERILEALQEPMHAGARDVVVTASIGIALGTSGRPSSDLVAAADIAMYQAKNAGKNRFVVADADADERALARLDIETELRRALAENELEIHYQPVMAAQTGELRSLEALVRWRHPTRGLVSPAEFMDVAEESGLVVPLGAWLLEQACVAAVDWNREHVAHPIGMAVNLSARQFQQPDLCKLVSDVLRRTGLEPRLLTLEITETVVMDETEATLATMRALKRLQVHLAIDDFGTGYSSLSYLKRFPVDVIKIDKSFVDGLGSTPVDREIVQAVIRLAAAVGMQTIAEGVESEEQRHELQLLGCSMLQGFLLARPAPLSELERQVVASIPPARIALDDRMSTVT